MTKSILQYMQEQINATSQGGRSSSSSQQPRAASAKGQRKKKLEKLFGGWTSTVGGDDPQGELDPQDVAINKAEFVLGGEETIDETNPISIFKGLNAAEVERRRREIAALSGVGRLPMGESNKPQPGTNRWWKWLGEQTKRNPKKTRMYSEEITRVISNRLHEEDEKWMQGAVKRPGALSKRLGIPEDEDIPLSTINQHIATLRKKAKGDKTLNKSDARFLHQLQFAKTAKTKVNK